MATAARGSFPGRPRKKLEKRRVKFKKSSHRNELGDLDVTCSFITNISRQFHLIFDDENEQDIEFIGFSSEECGLQAYKRIKKKNRVKAKASRKSDILGSQSNYDKEQVTTRLSHARLSVSDDHGDRSVIETPLRSPVSSLDGSRNITRDGESSSSDSAFLKYKDFKLDFHRLSRKARSKESYIDCSAEELAKRKDTSVKSLQYASDIYLAKDHGGIGSVRSPIKPATFIPPATNSDAQLHVSSVGATSLKIKKVPRIFEEVVSGGHRKGAGHPQVLAKALLARANRQSKRNGEETTSSSSQPPTKQKSKTPKTFVLPTKSARSSRIIKANRKYLNDQDSNSNSNRSSPIGKSTVPPTLSPERCSVNISRQETAIAELRSNNKGDERPKSPEVKKRKPLIKEPTFFSDGRTSTFSKSKYKEESKKDHRAHVRRLIKRARFKHPTSSEMLILGDDVPASSVIKEATFKAPNSKRRSLKLNADANDDDPSQFIEDRPQFGISPDLWSKVIESNQKSENMEQWSAQEVHNILHGVHTFSNAWTTIARHYHFKQSHKDWLSVRQKAVKCKSLGIFNTDYKVKSSTLLQLKPKMSDNPNVTVFSPYELKMRGLTHNVSCSIGEGGRALLTKEPAIASPGDVCSEDRIFGTQLNGQTVGKALKNAKFKDDVFLGMGEDSFRSMLKTRSQRKRWEIWEAHNVLHGIAYFGIGEWSKISNLYQFQPTHDNLAVRAMYKSLCCKRLIRSKRVQPEVVPSLRPVLSKAGRRYFVECGIPVLEYSLKVGKKMGKHKEVKQVKKQEKQRYYSSSDTDDQDINISPPRKQAYHLFGAVPVWDEAVQPDIIEDAETPVLQALENELYNGVHYPSQAPPASTITHPELSPGSPEHGVKPSKKSSKKKPSPENRGKGPRIKHVSRRASLVTGHSQAKNEDTAPHLSALPKVEREKIAAEVEKMKVNIPEFTSSESEEETKTKSSSNIPATVPRKEKTAPVKRKSTTTRCGGCETCLDPPCGDCDVCREGKDVHICLLRRACTNPTEVETPHQAKKAKRSLPEQQASRKSSRLQQQRVPIKSSQVPTSDTNGGQLTKLQSETVFASPAVQSGTKTTSLLKEVAMSPGSRYSAFQNVYSMNKMATISIENWKDVYEVSRLWKRGGRALIMSQPPPRIVCLICGSSSATAGLNEGALVHCACCCEPYHPFCAEKDFLSADVVTKMKKKTWVCRKCQCCHVCGHPKDLLVCRRCKKTYHSECLGPSYPTKPSKNKVWVCMRCVRCQSCGASKPGASGCKWTHDFTMCQRCGDLYEKGNFCPICQRCYSDEDYECRMIQCAGCKRWVHSKCESLSVEMYTLLAHMPNSVTYKCPDCDSRGSQLKQILTERADAVETLDESIKPEPEEVRKILSSLPAPTWKSLMEKEVQTGLEAVTMGLFHNRATCCILKNPGVVKSEPSDGKPIKPDDSARPHDLFAVRFAVHNGRYHSVGEFSSDVMGVLDSVADEGDRASVRKAFCKEAGSVFPWFNFETGKVRDSDDLPDYLLPNATMPPAPEHDYAQWQDKDIVTHPGTPNPSPMKSQCSSSTPSKSDPWFSPLKGAEDLRQCIFCSKYGDDHPMNAGRLLYCSQDEWCHVNCALWSAEVYEQHDGSLQNVQSAASRGKMMKCEHCKLPGATVGCNTRDCPKNYHFMCARNTDCSFQDDKKVFCLRHQGNAKLELLSDEEFEVMRMVCVDNDEMRPNRRWQRGILASSITVKVGSLTVHHLGRLGVASDTRDCLIPAAFRMTRVFWSAFFPSRKTVYTITVSEKKPSFDGNQVKPQTDNNNLTISHTNEDEDLPLMPPRSIIHSQSPSCVTNLAERMETTPPIGPLSPTRHRNPDRRPTGGTYTIISSINKTLPQMLTPLPTQPKYTKGKSTNSPINPVISPSNPFLRQIPEETSQIDTNSENKSTDCRNKNVQIEEMSFSSEIVSEERNNGKINSGSSGLVLSGTLDPLCNQTLKNEFSGEFSTSIIINPVFSDTIGNPQTSTESAVGDTVPAETLAKDVLESVKFEADFEINNCKPKEFVSNTEPTDSVGGTLQLRDGGKAVNQSVAVNQLDNAQVLPDSSQDIYVEGNLSGNEEEKVLSRVRSPGVIKEKESLNEKTENDLQIESSPERMEEKHFPKDKSPESMVEKSSAHEILSDMNRETIDSKDDKIEEKSSPKEKTLDKIKEKGTANLFERKEEKASQKVIFETYKTNHEDQVSCKQDPPMEISLLRSAKQARDAEDATPASKSPPLDTMGLWWKKNSQQKMVPQITGAKHRKTRATREGKLDSENEDPSFEMESGKFWKRKPGGEGLAPLSSEDSIGSRGKSKSFCNERVITNGVCNDDNGSEDSENEDFLESKTKESDRSPSENKEERSPEKSHFTDSENDYVGKKTFCKEKVDVTDAKLETENSLPSFETPSKAKISEISLLTSPSVVIRCARLNIDEKSIKNQIYNNEDTYDVTKVLTKSMRKFARTSQEGGDPKKLVNSGLICPPMLTRQRSKSQDDVIKLGKNLKPKETIHFSDSSVTTRSRSRNSSVSTAVLPLSRPVTPDSEIDASFSNTGSQTPSLDENEKNMSRSDSADNDSLVTPRRYPRRNTYTCLRSFSGLSPNYALASYSRLHQNRENSEESENTEKCNDLHQKSELSNETLEISLEKEILKETEQFEHKTAVNEPIPQNLENDNNTTPILEENPSESECVDTKQTKTSLATSEIETTSKEINFTKNPELSSAVNDEISSCSGHTEVDNPDDGTKTSDSNPEYPLSDQEAAKTPEDICEDLSSSKMKDEVMESNAPEEEKDLPSSLTKAMASNTPITTSCNPVVICAFSSSIEDEVRTSNEDQVITADVPIICEDQSSCHLEDKSSDEKDDSSIIAILSALPDVTDEERVSTPDKSFRDDSIEIPRGGEDDLPSSGDALHSPLPKMEEQHPIIDTPLKEEELPEATVESLKDDSSFLVTSECPVLNADEVQTLLESPEPVNSTPLSPPMQYNYIQPQQPVCQPPVINYPLYGLPRPMVQTPRFMGVTPKQRPTIRRHIQQSIPRTYTPRNKMPQVPRPPFQELVTMTAHPWVRSTPVIVQPSISRVASPYPPARNMTPTFNNPNTYPQQFQPQVAPNTLLPVAYSLRVTMAMAGDLNTDTLAPPTITRLNFTNQPRKPTNTCPRHPNQPSNQQINQSMVNQSPQTGNVPNHAPENQTSTESAADQASALERLIEFYSAKNKLTAEEKKIVRSIISSQIQSKQLPMPSAHHTPPSQAIPEDQMRQKSSGIKRRRSSEIKTEEKRAKLKKKRMNLLPSVLDESWSTNEDDSLDTGSTLVDIYNNRDALIKKKKNKPISKLLAPYNIYIGPKYDHSKENRTSPPLSSSRPYLVYNISSEDGYAVQGTDLQELISQLLSTVQECRTTREASPTVALHAVMTPFSFLGVSHDAIRFLVEQLPGARYCHRYRAKYHKHKKATEEVTHINPHGCARAEQYKGRSKPDMFSFLASKHRYPPEYDPDRQDDDSLNPRRSTGLDLPMAMRFRQLRQLTRDSVGVFRSTIHGRGLYCKRDFDGGEMIMEYTGQIIRRELTDKREKYYESKSIGCYMFRMDDYFVVDATVLGSGARFINHSCEPNCYSRIVQFEGKKHIVIFALRRILRGEELTYDYKFPIEDDSHKIACHCGARLCRKFMN